MFSLNDSVKKRWHILLWIVCTLTVSCESRGRFWEDVSVGRNTSSPATCTETIASDFLTMVCVPANITGFLMGSAVVGGSSIPEHTVASITAFAMAKYELQFGDWLTVKTWAGANGYSIINPGVQGDNGLRTDQHPVTTVTWRDAMVWCNAASEKQGLTPVYYADAVFSTPIKASTNSGSVNNTPGSEDNPYVQWSANGYRLPTEAEWEYAARYVDGLTYNRGDAPSGWQDNNPANGTVDASEINVVMWYSVNGSNMTHPVGGKASNALGIFDMSGNVWEYVWDWHAPTYATSTPYTDPDSKGPTSGTVRGFREGSFLNPAVAQRTSNRLANSPSYKFNDLGLRPVRRP